MCVWQRESSQTATVPHVTDTLCNYSAEDIALLLFVSRCGRPFISSMGRGRKKTLLLSWQSGNRLSFLASPLLTGKSVSCRRWKDCGLFSGENRTISPTLLPVPSALCNLTHGWSSLSLYCIRNKSPGCRCSKRLNILFLAACGHRKWSSLPINCVCSRVWPARGSCLQRSVPVYEKGEAKWNRDMWRQLILSFPKEHPCGQKEELEQAGDFSRRPLIVQNEPLAMSEIYDLLKKTKENFIIEQLYPWCQTLISTHTFSTWNWVGRIWPFLLLSKDNTMTLTPTS